MIIILIFFNFFLKKFPKSQTRLSVIESCLWNHQLERQMKYHMHIRALINDLCTIVMINLIDWLTRLVNWCAVMIKRQLELN